jgi:hypothetical protein
VTVTPLVSTVTSSASTLSSTTTTATTVGVTTSSLAQNTTPDMTTVDGVSASTSRNSREAGASTLETEKQSHAEPGVGFQQECIDCEHDIVLFLNYSCMSLKRGTLSE